MQSWGSEKHQIKAGGREKIIQTCVEGGVRVGESTIKRIAREAKLQEEESARRFMRAGLGSSKAWITARVEKENVAGRAN